jgi:hypothetical protein
LPSITESASSRANFGPGQQGVAAVVGPHEIQQDAGEGRALVDFLLRNAQAGQFGELVQGRRGCLKRLEPTIALMVAQHLAILDEEDGDRPCSIVEPELIRPHEGRPANVCELRVRLRRDRGDDGVIGISR